MSLRVGLVGCGAVSRIYYAGALVKVCKTDPSVEIVGLFDPDLMAFANFDGFFVAPAFCTSWSDFIETKPDLVILASPPAFHASQGMDLVARGISVLCEKPLATTYVDALALVEAAETHGQRLSVGMVRRHLPVALNIHRLIRSSKLGALRRLNWLEGNRFRWPIASTAYFDRDRSGGGVLMDIGIHVFDLLTWWFGDLDLSGYQDDALGGVETNCLVHLRDPTGAPITVRLTRDDDPPVACRIEFESGVVTWLDGNPTDLNLELRGHHEAAAALELVKVASEVTSFEEAFVIQIREAIEAIRSRGDARISPRSALPALALIEACYSDRSVLPMPWLSTLEQTNADEWSWGSS